MQYSRKRPVTLLLLLLALNQVTLRAEVPPSDRDCPVPIVAPPSEYPADLKHDQIDGVVIIVVSVNKLGFVEDCIVKKSSQVEF